jgi:hypothetical protein
LFINLILFRNAFVDEEVSEEDLDSDEVAELGIIDFEALGLESQSDDDTPVTDLDIVAEEEVVGDSAEGGARRSRRSINNSVYRR